MQDDAVRKEGYNKGCPGCGAGLVFRPSLGKLWCSNCDGSYDFEKVQNLTKHDLRAADRDSQEYKEWAEQAKIFKCSTCGADVVLNKLDITGKCPYCGSDYVSETKEIAGMKPDSVVPFAYDTDTIATKFRNSVRKRFFVPSAFKKTLVADKIHAFYVPSFIFDVNTSSVYDGVLTKTKTVRTKNGTKTVTERFHVSGTLSSLFNDVVIEASSKIDESQIKSLLPYDFSKSYNFDQNFLRGYPTEHYADDVDKSFSTCKNELYPLIRQKILSKYSHTGVEYLNINTSYSNEKYAYRLLPLYNLEFLYRKKNYMVVMNGQTGKVGKGLPKSALKVTIVTLLTIILIAAFVAIWYFTE